MPNPRRPFMWVPMATILLGIGGSGVLAAAPRSQRVAERIAERAYARQSIAEARAARAEARVAEIAPFVPVPPPPRPATVRRMARAGVPLGPPASGSGPLPARLPPAAAPAFASAPPTTPPSISVPATAQTPRATAATPQKEARDVVADDGTRSVLATAETPATQPATREPAGAAVTHPPIELLPTPRPQ